MEKHPLEGLTSESMEQIKKLVDVNTIVGNPVTTPDGTTIIPVSKVTFGFGSGGSEFSQRPDSKAGGNLFGGATGGTVSINPVAFLVVNSDHVRLLSVNGSTTTADKLIDLIPELITKVTKLTNEMMDKRAARKAKEAKASEVEVEASEDIEL